MVTYNNEKLPMECPKAQYQDHLYEIYCYSKSTIGNHLNRFCRRHINNLKNSVQCQRLSRRNEPKISHRENRSNNLVWDAKNGRDIGRSRRYNVAKTVQHSKEDGQNSLNNPKQNNDKSRKTNSEEKKNSLWVKDLRKHN